MKVLILITLLFSLPYKPHDLEWSDYKGKPEKGKWLAQTASEIDEHFSFYKGIDSLLEYEATAKFIPSESYTKTKNLYILSHERLHFAITKLYATKLNAALRGKKSYTNAKMHSISDRLINEWNKAQQDYDEETNHSANHTEQARWEKYINEQRK